MLRVIVHLNREEWDALRQAAEREVRGLREQARYFIIRGLTAEGAARANNRVSDQAPPADAQLERPGGEP